MNLTAPAARYFPNSCTSIADHKSDLRLWVLLELIGKGQGSQHNQPVQDHREVSQRPTRGTDYPCQVLLKNCTFLDNRNRKQRYVLRTASPLSKALPIARG